MIEDRLQDSVQPQPSTLEEYEIVESAPRKDYDEITFLAAQICNAPRAAILILENGDSWVKASYGFSDTEQLQPEMPDSFLKDKRVFYLKDFRLSSQNNYSTEFQRKFLFAGIPLITREGASIGVLFVLDPEPQDLSATQERAMEFMANQILSLLEYRKQTDELEAVQRKLKQKYRDLEKFASVVSHDIKSPLANIISLTELLQEENRGAFNEESQQYLDFLTQSSYSLRNYVDGILTFYRSDNILEKEKEDVHLEKLFKNIADLYQFNADVKITYPTSGVLQKVNKAALTQIFLNLISNALKYNTKQERRVDISFTETEENYKFEVRDNGNGIPPKDFDRIFELFTTLDHNDRDGNPGSGIGLATVKKMLDHMEGSIKIESSLNEGSNFKFEIKRK